jgi:hypothetical protein
MEGGMMKGLGDEPSLRDVTESEAKSERPPWGFWWGYSCRMLLDAGSEHMTDAEKVSMLTTMLKGLRKDGSSQ